VAAAAVTRKPRTQSSQVPGEVERRSWTTADGGTWTMSVTAPDSRASNSESRATSLPTIKRGLDDRWIGAA
jgi:hypothetical protein